MWQICHGYSRTPRSEYKCPSTESLLFVMISFVLKINSWQLAVVLTLPEASTTIFHMVGWGVGVKCYVCLKTIRAIFFSTSWNRQVEGKLFLSVFHVGNMNESSRASRHQWQSHEPGITRRDVAVWSGHWWIQQPGNVLWAIQEILSRRNLFISFLSCIRGQISPWLRWQLLWASPLARWWVKTWAHFPQLTIILKWCENLRLISLQKRSKSHDEIKRFLLPPPYSQKLHSLW